MNSGDIANHVLALADRISKLSNQLARVLNDDPLKAREAVYDLPEYDHLRASVGDVVQELLMLVNGPQKCLQRILFSHYDHAALQVALDRNFFKYIPLPGTIDDGKAKVAKINVDEIATRAGMDIDRTHRILKLLATQGIFQEIEGEPGCFTHSDASATLARDAAFYSLADMQMDDMLKASSQTSSLIAESAFLSDASHSPFYMHYGTTMYQYYDKHPDKASRFAEAMSAWSRLQRQTFEISDAYPWSSLGDGLVVDVGGGSGHVSIALAQKFPSLRFIVQDLSKHMLSHGLEEMSDRLSFQQHDFFQPQPVKDASAYLLRQCIHNNNDSDSIKILQAMVPALEDNKPGTPLLINDIVMPVSGTITRTQEHEMRQVDMCMMVTLGAKQRTLQDFEVLLERADKRFSIVSAQHSSQGLGLLEVHLNKTN